MDSAPTSAMMLMALASGVAAVCALAAGRAVPWQGRQAAVAMPIGMLALLVPAAVPTIAVAALWTISAMLGTIGLRGRPEVANCCHRALGTLAMALCLLAGAVHGVAGGPHATHVTATALPVISGVAVSVLVVWSIIGMRHPPGNPLPRGTASLLRIEAATMSLGLIAMWVWHAIA